jgi:hypothetical protein
MLNILRAKTPLPKNGSSPTNFSITQLTGDASLPVTIKALNSLPNNPKLRIYRTLIPTQVLVDFDINPRTWENPEKHCQVLLEAEEGSSRVKISAWYGDDLDNQFFYLELADNMFEVIDLNFLILNDPLKEKYKVDVTEDGKDTQFGTVYRNLAEEVRAMRAGLAPGQIRSGLRCSKTIFAHIESFLTLLSQQSLFLEPLTYASAWIFERRGFAYVRGRTLMDTIQKEFQPGGELHKALDGSTPFRQPDQWRTVRGRAWAIQDGLLGVIDKNWDDLRMIKQLGRYAGVNTFPGAAY